MCLMLGEWSCVPHCHSRKICYMLTALATGLRNVLRRTINKWFRASVCPLAWWFIAVSVHATHIPQSHERCTIDVAKRAQARLIECTSSACDGLSWMCHDYSASYESNLVSSAKCIPRPVTNRLCAMKSRCPTCICNVDARMKCRL